MHLTKISLQRIVSQLFTFFAFNFLNESGRKVGNQNYKQTHKTDTSFVNVSVALKMNHVDFRNSLDKKMLFNSSDKESEFLKDGVVKARGIRAVVRIKQPKSSCFCEANVL